jgi:hypothetical protein
VLRLPAARVTSPCWQADELGAELPAPGPAAAGARIRTPAHKIAAVARVPSAVVLGVGGAAGVSALRLLGRRGLRVYAVDHKRSPLGFRSRYAVARRVPDPEQDESRFAEALRALGDELGGNVPIFPARDEDLNALARNAPQS